MSNRAREWQDLSWGEKAICVVSIGLLVLVLLKNAIMPWLQK